MEEAHSRLSVSYFCGRETRLDGLAPIIVSRSAPVGVVICWLRLLRLSLDTWLVSSLLRVAVHVIGIRVGRVAVLLLRLAV
jgi:hypothetical protein